MSATTHPTVSHEANTDGARTPADTARRVLRANAAFTAVSAAALLVGADAVGDLLGTGHPGWIRLVGLGLAVFAVAVGATSAISDEARLRAETLAIAAADGAWVAASAVAVALGWFDAEGTVAIVGVALVVGSFAVMEMRAGRSIVVDPS